MQLAEITLMGAALSYGQPCTELGISHGDATLVDSAADAGD